MPGSTVTTTAPQARKEGNSPSNNAWHATSRTNLPKAPPMPHGLSPWPGAHPQSTLQTHTTQPKV